ncbi:hypothetical protein [Tunicatimonas pelagia]|uniref:hypothetical protein n=1 Tax=Tunicatimonas pelagia TaxID=931531 RepID=UPI002665936E|nr:hypothetical protein [Tunicatimonas pelagia]WKN46505.1 hypothetical protein P0M28_30610 [Tunicatimonas pelagia]
MFRNIFLIFFLSILVTPCYSQDTSEIDLSKIKKFTKRFNKRKFLESIEKKRETVESVVRRLQRLPEDYDFSVFESDSSMIANYQSVKEAFNSTLDTMATDINSVKTIFGFTFFDASKKYEDQLSDAEKKANNFIEQGEEELKGKVAGGLLDLIKWVVEIWPLIKNLNDTYLEHVKPIMVERIEQEKFKNWAEII